jgi:hypothetical protein
MKLIARSAGLLMLLLFPAVGEAETSVERYRAWDAYGDPTISEFVERRGECASSSFALSRQDTWRCFSGNFIHDPCFEDLRNGNGREVICVASPWARRGVLLRDRLDYDNRTRVGGSRPWAIRTAAGRRCIWVSGASNVVRGRRLNYVCGRGDFGTFGSPFLFGLPDRRRPTWTIVQARSYDGRGWRRVRIRTAWR